MLRFGRAVILTFAVAACARGAKGEAAALSDAVDRYRHADGAAKAAFERQAVANAVCTHSAVCAAKEACMAAIDPTTRAMALKEEVAARLGDLQEKRLAPDSAEAAALPEKLDLAEHLLGEGRVKMSACDSKLLDLTR